MPFDYSGSGLKHAVEASRGPEPEAVRERTPQGEAAFQAARARILRSGSVLAKVRVNLGWTVDDLSRKTIVRGGPDHAIVAQVSARVCARAESTDPAERRSVGDAAWNLIAAAVNQPRRQIDPEFH